MAKHGSAGNTHAYFGFVDTLGFLTGESTSAPAQNTLSPMRRLLGIQSATPGIPEGEDVGIDGDDGTVGTISFPANTTPAWIANFGVEDLEVDAALQETSVLSLAGYQMGVLQPADPGAPNGCLIYQSRAISKDDSDTGLAIWTGTIYPLVTTQILGRESFEGRTAAVYRRKFTAQIAGHLPNGITITASNLGTTGATGIPFRGNYPLIMDRYTGNGVATSITLTKQVASTSFIAAIVNTQVLTHGAGITATVGSQTLTFSSPPAANAKVIIMYGFIP